MKPRDEGGPMAVSSRSYILEFDREKRKCRLGDESFVYFKGCANKDDVKKKVEEQKKKDEDKPPVAPPTDRDGYLYCDVVGSRTYHWVTTSPPYTDTDLGVPC